MSLKLRFVIALVATSALVLAVVAVVTPVMLKYEFLEDAKVLHYTRFANSIEDYRRRHQSWNTDADAARYADIIAQRRAGGADGRPPLRPRPGFPPPHPHRTLEGLAQAPENPGFRFVLADPAGRVLLGGMDYQPGDRLSAATLEQAESLALDGEVIAFVLPSGELQLSEADQSFLYTLEETLLFAALIAMLVVIPLGIWEAGRLVGTLKSLTGAVNRMARGDLQQSVRVTGNDEVGELASAFNVMNGQLVEAYRNLEESRDQVARQAEQLRELSIRDELTGLYNRRFFNEEVKVLFANALRYGQGFCVVLGDIDFFKKINDNYSHATGDEVLRRVAEILRDGSRSSDIVARYGGEEMVIAMPNTGRQAALDMMERIRLAIQNHPWSEVAEGLQVTMSFGVCDQPRGEAFEQMLAAADEQLYRAKHNGRNQVCMLEQP